MQETQEFWRKNRDFIAIFARKNFAKAKFLRQNSWVSCMFLSKFFRKRDYIAFLKNSKKTPKQGKNCYDVDASIDDVAIFPLFGRLFWIFPKILKNFLKMLRIFKNFLEFSTFFRVIHEKQAFRVNA